MKSKKIITNPLKTIDWPMTIMNLLILVLTWSAVPLEYASTIDTSSLKASWGFLFTYQLGIALVAILLFNHHFQNVWATFGILLAVLAAGGATRSSGALLSLLMLLLPVFFILLAYPRTHLQSIYGLIGYAFLSSICISVPFIKVSAGFISWQAVWFLVPLILSFVFFDGPIFLRQDSWKQVAYSVTGLLLLVAILVKGISVAHVLAGFIVVATWLLMVSKKRPIDEFLTYSLFQLLCVLLMYWR